jgi:hypothetical protein
MSNEIKTPTNIKKLKGHEKTKEEMMAIRPANPALKHGLYSDLRPQKIDQRTRLAKYAKEVRAELLGSLGGEDNLSAQEKIIMDDLIIPQLLAVRSFIQKAMQPGFQAGESTIKYWVSLSNSLRLNLCALGLDRKVKDITPLSERLAALAARTEKGEGDNSHG